MGGNAGPGGKNDDNPGSDGVSDAATQEAEAGKAAKEEEQEKKKEKEKSEAEVGVGSCAEPRMLIVGPLPP